MLKAFRINEADTFAGRTLEEAVQAAIDQRGYSREDALEEGYGFEADPSGRVWDEDEGETTVGAVLALMTKPGLVCSTEI